MVEDIPARRNSTLPSKKAYPQSALRLTAPSAEGAFRHTPRKASPERGGARRRRAEGAFRLTSRKASPERGGARRRRAEGFVPQRRDHNQV